ncbi:SDR family NAD(P)-dependent oxidoreductase [Legionella maioricensis]|uniref:SDR family oxidoreductase n=1 Tax=Legionella maioricensis TaxID=2896528 RepID=A0A9X2IB84_9GAMM|nr:SDR family oxidoreductase [Legionella maioricensis]MCL9684709.1 SDR family oxidoreductase [Legionella maioricensis]MCL9687737.1 SDR family oxidoreductase [Legionella maioricensis]
MNLLITGGSSDIAQAIAKRRIHAGDQIIITCSSEQSLQQTLEHYQQQKMAVTGFVYNFSEPEACEENLAKIMQEPIDGLILNAFTRVTQLRKLHALPYNAVRTYIDNNLHGNIWLIHRLLPGMLANKFGRLILISSLSSITGTSRYSAYCTAKAALEGLFFNLAVDYSANNILSNILRVGLIKTSRTEQFWTKPLYQEKMAQIIPQGAMGEPEQVAETTDPLLSKSSFMTGSVVTVSGGLPLMRSEGLLS